MLNYKENIRGKVYFSYTKILMYSFLHLTQQKESLITIKCYFKAIRITRSPF